MTKRVQTFKVGVFREVRPGRVDRWAAYTRYYACDWIGFHAEIEVLAESGDAAKKLAIDLCKRKVADGESAS
jgi:hypothetical protein